MKSHLRMTADYAVEEVERVGKDVHEGVRIVNSWALRNLASRFDDDDGVGDQHKQNRKLMTLGFVVNNQSGF